jgi:hypothetical protein
VKRASYREACTWVAQNDSAFEGAEAFNAHQVGHLISCLLVADIFRVEPEKVGRDVVRARRAYFKKKGWEIPVECPDCSRTTPHVHCPECGSIEHVAEDCDMEG